MTKSKDQTVKANATNSDSGTTTILPEGTVESRGIGTLSHDEVSQEIQTFLNGEGKLSLDAEMRGFFTVWMFITRLPVPTWVDLHPGYLMRGMTYFPISGALIGIFVSAFYDICSLTLSLPCIISSIVSEVASFWITGCFHEDGLADSADGIGGGWTTEQILRIMTDTRLGTFGCAYLALYIIAKLELIAILGNSVWCMGSCEGGGPAIIVSHSLARLVAPILIKTKDYVDEGGPKYQFYNFFLQAKYLVTWSRVFFAILTSFAVAYMTYGLQRGMLLVVAVIIMAYISGQYADYLLGGVMGDYIGGTICVTEVYLLSIIALMSLCQEHILLVSSQFLDICNTFIEATNDTATTTAQAVTMASKLLIENESIFAVVKFLTVITFTAVYRTNVGYPPLPLRKTVTSKGETDQKQTSLNESTAATSKSKNENNKEEKDNEEQPSNELEAALIDPQQNFTQRYDAVRLYLDSLAKPVGSLGSMEDWASRITALQRTTKPKADNAVCLIFAADHGVAKDESDGGANCSAYPQAVSRKVLEGLDHGIAGASVLSKCNDVSLRVIDVGLADGACHYEWSGNVVHSSRYKIRGGTKNFCKGSAMTEEQVGNCLLAGREETRGFIDEVGASVVIFGEVGIGNTTTSSALIAALTGMDAESLCGSGASTTRDGVNRDIVSKKISIIKNAMQHHDPSSIKGKPLQALGAVGGAEIAAIVGGILEASERDIPVLVDGFIVTTAVMIACQIDPSVCRVLLFATQSTEKGQIVALQTIGEIATSNNIPALSKPALCMNLRMGEATGALAAISLVRSACAVMSDLAALTDVLGLEMKSC